MPTAYAGSPETAWGLTVSADGHVYVATHECPDISGGVPTHLYSLKSSGVVETNWPVSSRAMYWAAAVSSSGTIFQMDEYNILTAYRPDGISLWAVGLPGFGQGPIALDASDNIYVGTDGNLYGGHTVYSFTSSGTLRAGWPQDTGGASVPTAVATDLSNGTTYLSTANTSNASLYAFTLDGSLRSGFPVTVGGSVAQYPLALAPNGIVYYKTSAGLFAIKPDGTSAWSVPFAPGGDPSLSPGPVVDVNAAVYVAFGDKLYALNPDGSVRTGWPVTLPSAGELVIGGSGLLYATSAGQKLYKIATGAACTNSQCDDGNPCNGTETCDPGTGRCIAGTIPDKLCSLSKCSDLCKSGKLAVDGITVLKKEEDAIKSIAAHTIGQLMAKFPARNDRLRVAAEAGWWGLNEGAMTLPGPDCCCTTPLASTCAAANMCSPINALNTPLFSNCSAVVNGVYIPNEHLYCQPLAICDPAPCASAPAPKSVRGVCSWQVGVAASYVPRHTDMTQDGADDAAVLRFASAVFPNRTTSAVLSDVVSLAGLDATTGAAVISSDAACNATTDKRDASCRLRRNWLLRHPAIGLAYEDTIVRQMCVSLPTNFTLVDGRIPATVQCNSGGCASGRFGKTSTDVCNSMKDLVAILNRLSPPGT
jgi:hypothetical protein